MIAARCDYCGRLRPLNGLIAPLPKRGDESRWGAGRCVVTEDKACNAEHARKVRAGLPLFACRHPGPEGCPRTFATIAGRNQHERRGHRL